jgi:hypothetical protein|uniref:Uncharacterized protein n=1 Tax=viral metagenome TaxID=1070528 RepID=A0A6C0B334_9ZZZZ
MYIFFSVTEVEELFTTYDYKQLIKAVEAHVNECAKSQNVRASGVMAYYNPQSNQGVVHIDETYRSVYVPPIQHAYGTDFITIKFK